LTKFDQTFTTNGLKGEDTGIKFSGQKIKGQGQDGGGMILDEVVTTI